MHCLSISGRPIGDTMMAHLQKTGLVLIVEDAQSASFELDEGEIEVIVNKKPDHVLFAGFSGATFDAWIEEDARLVSHIRFHVRTPNN